MITYSVDNKIVLNLPNSYIVIKEIRETTKLDPEAHEQHKLDIYEVNKRKT